MDAFERLRNLNSKMGLESDDTTNCPKLSARRQEDVVISNAKLPNGRSITLLKTLLTSVCERDCYYCPFRAGRDFRRATLSPDEMADVFMALYRSGVVQGLFLSSGLAGGSIKTQDRLIATAEILRHRKKFQGYIHLKLMPGAERAQVERILQLADRVSLNLEAPNPTRLEKLAPHKGFINELLRPLHWMDEIRQSHPARFGWKGRWPSMTTQYVVGAAGESDLELLSTTAFMHRDLHLERAYFSAFQPVKDTPLEDSPPTSPVRELHLYMASFLLRDYGFEVEELLFDHSGNLPMNIDPKLAWAHMNLTAHPVEVNVASRHELVRIPGIGPKGAQAIQQARRRGCLNSLEDLKRIGIISSRAAPFILLNGKQPVRQLALF